MDRGEDLHARTELAAISDGHSADIENDAVEVEEYPVA